MSSGSSGSVSYPFLSFVHINNPEDSKLRSKRRAVRSHAAHHQHLHRPNANGSAIASANGNGNERQPNQREGVSRPRRQSREVRHEIVQQPVVQNPSTTPVPKSDIMKLSFLLCADEVDTRDDDNRPIPNAPRNDENNTCKKDDSMLGGNCSATYAEKRELLVILPHERYSPPSGNLFHGLRVDPFQSYPVPLRPGYDSIIDFYTERLCGDIPLALQPGSTLSFRSLWFPLVLQSPTIFYAIMSLSSTIRHLQHGTLANQPYQVKSLHQNAVDAFNKQFSNINFPIDDISIAAMYCMATLDSLHGNAIAYDMHMSGLAHMVYLRGGLHRLGLRGLLTSMILWLDFNQSKIRGSDMYFAESIEMSRKLSSLGHDNSAQTAAIPYRRKQQKRSVEITLKSMDRTATRSLVEAGGLDGHMLTFSQAFLWEGDVSPGPGGRVDVAVHAAKVRSSMSDALTRTRG